MATLSNITVKKELRLCKIDEELGYFHCWEQYGDIIFPGITVGSNPGGQYSRVFGIVEFDDRVKGEGTKWLSNSLYLQRKNC